MSFIMKEKGAVSDIILDAEEFSGVKRAAGWVSDDICCVTGKKSAVVEFTKQAAAEFSGKPAIFAGTLGHDRMVDLLCLKYGINVSEITGKREVYGIFETPVGMLVAGSDKRGTIYGLLHISEAIGITPMKFWGDVEPVKYSNIIFTTSSDAIKMNKTAEKGLLFACVTGISKEPSVKYRGFFINDEWPAFGNWSQKHFGDANAACYEPIFEYVLRLKGNYLWPAMWSETFWSDGPGLASAELADELGVVMGTSHHEPCIRAGEEFVRLNQVHKEYGSVWNFITNEEGITKFWEDSLKEREKFENIITVGMRGERDSKLFDDAKLIDNINVLKKVISCQKKLIEKYSAKADGSGELPPMMLAIYKEVEEYYKGDARTQGLKEWDGLDGITLMLCDDNFGNLRLMPDEDKRNHKGGYGMYYHFDYHGDPVSYEWINSSYLPKIWEQMTTCYDFGIREIWIVNVGDIKNQELPLNYFMDLAYDFEKYGTSKPGNYRQYLTDWVGAQFAGLDRKRLGVIRELIDGYTRLNNIIKPEVLGMKRYPITQHNNADEVLAIADNLEQMADCLLADFAKSTKLKSDILENIAEIRHFGLAPLTLEELAASPKDSGLARYFNSYISLVYYQAKATFNLVRMWIYADKNNRNALMGRASSHIYRNCANECLYIDRENINLFHGINNKKWYGMGLSKHIGFKNWNDEGSRNPVLSDIFPIAGTEVVVSDIDSDEWSVGGPWCRKPVRLSGFCYRGFGGIDICDAGLDPVSFEIESRDELIEFLVTGDDGMIPECLTSSGRLVSKKALCNKKWTKTVSGKNKEGDTRVYVRIAPDSLERAAGRHEFKVRTNAGEVLCYFDVSEKIFAEGNEFGIIKEKCIGASEYSRLIPSKEGEFVLIDDLGRLLPGQDGASLKAYPQSVIFKKGPAAEYDVDIEKEGEYLLFIWTSASNPAYDGSIIHFYFTVNDNREKKVSVLQSDFIGGDRTCTEWSFGVLTNAHRSIIRAKMRKGKNVLRFRALDPGFVLEKIEIAIIE